MTLPLPFLAFLLAVTFALGACVGGIVALSIAMRAVKHAEGVGYDR